MLKLPKTKLGGISRGSMISPSKRFRPSCILLTAYTPSVSGHHTALAIADRARRSDNFVPGADAEEDPPEGNVRFLDEEVEDRDSGMNKNARELVEVTDDVSAAPPKLLGLRSSGDEGVCVASYARSRMR